MFQTIGITPDAIESIIEFLHENLIADEPIDSFALCNKNKLDSCLKTPFQRPEKEDRLEDFIDKSSLLFFLLIENHVLPTNGNKRLATHAFLAMIFTNGFEILSSKEDLYHLAIKVTEMAKNRIPQEEILEMIRAFCKQYVVLDLIGSNQLHSDLKKSFSEYLFSER